MPGNSSIHHQFVVPSFNITNKKTAPYSAAGALDLFQQPATITTTPQAGVATY